MERRKFLIGTGALAAGGAAALGSGAFSRVESHRSVTIEVAEDPDAYLGLDEGDSPNGENYVSLDENGHVEIDIGENPNDGKGVNSNSLTFFDNLLSVCNQGKEDAGVFFNPTPLSDDSGAVAAFYVGQAQGSNGLGGIQLVHDPDVDVEIGGDNVNIGAFDLQLGECEQVGLVVDTGNKLGLGGEKVNAKEAEGPIIDEYAEITADVEYYEGDG